MTPINTDHNARIHMILTRSPWVRKEPQDTRWLSWVMIAALGLVALLWGAK